MNRNLTFSQASLSASPPPKRKMMPQGSFVSTSFQSIKDGEVSWFERTERKGQKLKVVGNAKATKTIWWNKK